MTRSMLEHFFPRLLLEDYEITSEFDVNYNCIAHALNQNDVFWSPAMEGIEGFHWPRGLNQDDGVNTWIQLFEMEGFAICDSHNFEEGFEKIAIYVDAEGDGRHVARQISPSAWTSKLGQLEDISHPLSALEDDQAQPSPGQYGKAQHFMKRPIERLPMEG